MASVSPTLETPPGAPAKRPPLYHWCLSFNTGSTVIRASERWVLKTPSTGPGTWQLGPLSLGGTQRQDPLLPHQPSRQQAPHAWLPTWCLALYTGQAHTEPGGLLPHARLPSYLRSSPGAASPRAPHTLLSVRGACEEGQGPGCPQPMADPKAPIS